MVDVDLINAPALLGARPRFLKVAPNVVGVQFPLMKLLPAHALLAGVSSRTPVIETSSGTMGLALAMVSAWKGLDLTLVTPVLRPSFRTHLRSIGRTSLIEVDGNQADRLDRLDEQRRQRPDLHWTNQYGSQDVPTAYQPVGTALASLKVDTLLAPVGSGGSAAGIIAPLREANPHARLIAVDAMNSVLFGRDDGPRKTPGLGNSIRPEVFDQGLFDQVHWMSDETLWQAARFFARETGLFIGPSAAGALVAALWHAERAPQVRFAAILPDEGHRYLDTVFRIGPSQRPVSPISLGYEEARCRPAGHDWLIADLQR